MHFFIRNIVQYNTHINPYLHWNCISKKYDFFRFVSMYFNIFHSSQMSQNFKRGLNGYWIFSFQTQLQVYKEFQTQLQDNKIGVTLAISMIFFCFSRLLIHTLVSETGLQRNMNLKRWFTFVETSSKMTVLREPNNWSLGKQQKICKIELRLNLSV